MGGRALGRALAGWQRRWLVLRAGQPPGELANLRACAARCRAIEAVGLAPRGQGGRFIEDAYERLFGSCSSSQAGSQQQQQQQQQQPGSSFPINTHGGLLGQGAPWEAPAMFSLVEAVAQLRGEAEGRQVPGASRALVYGNGGVFSASAVAILERCGGAAAGSGAAGPASKL